MRSEMIAPSSLGRSTPWNGLRALGAVIRREWMIFLRYPSWIVSLFWPQCGTRPVTRS